METPPLLWAACSWNRYGWMQSHKCSWFCSRVLLWGDLLLRALLPVGCFPFPSVRSSLVLTVAGDGPLRSCLSQYSALSMCFFLILVLSLSWFHSQCIGGATVLFPSVLCADIMWSLHGKGMGKKFHCVMVLWSCCSQEWVQGTPEEFLQWEWMSEQRSCVCSTSGYLLSSMLQPSHKNIKHSFPLICVMTVEIPVWIWQDCWHLGCPLTSWAWEKHPCEAAPWRQGLFAPPGLVVANTQKPS